VASSTDTWLYLAFSLELNADLKNSDVQLFIGTNLIDTASSSSDDTNDMFFVDNATYHSFIGAQRTAASAYDAFFDGFVYEFAVYQAAYSKTTMTEYATTCDAGCWTFTCANYADGDACSTDPSCTDETCVRDLACDVTTCSNSMTHCNLCADAECQYCKDYTTCEKADAPADHCGPNATFTDSNSLCKCDDFFGRFEDSKDLKCKPCHTNCKDCDIGGIANYYDCVECGNNTYGVKIAD
jgi:hypothetical protein